MLDDEFAIRRAAEHRVWRAWYAALVASCWSFILLGFTARNLSLASPGVEHAAVDASITLVLGWSMQRWNSPIAAGLLTFRAVTGGTVALANGLVVRGLVGIGVFGTLFFLGLLGTLVLRRRVQLSSDVERGNGQAGV